MKFLNNLKPEPQNTPPTHLPFVFWRMVILVLMSFGMGEILRLFGFDWIAKNDWEQLGFFIMASAVGMWILGWYHQTKQRAEDKNASP